MARRWRLALLPEVILPITNSTRINNSCSVEANNSSPASSHKPRQTLSGKHIMALRTAFRECIRSSLVSLFMLLTFREKCLRHASCNDILLAGNTQVGNNPQRESPGVPHATSISGRRSA